MSGLSLIRLKPIASQWQRIWQLTVVRNREAQNVELTPEMEEEPDANSPYDQLVHDERMNLINRLVNELPEKQRFIMQLRDIEGESYKKLRFC